jgi:hypothetical protein
MWRDEIDDSLGVIEPERAAKKARTFGSPCRKQATYGAKPAILYGAVTESEFRRCEKAKEIAKHRVQSHAVRLISERDASINGDPKELSVLLRNGFPTWELCAQQSNLQLQLRGSSTQT